MDNLLKAHPRASIGVGNRRATNRGRGVRLDVLRARQAVDRQIVDARVSMPRNL